MDPIVWLAVPSIIALSYYLEEKHRWFAHVSGVLLIILFSALLANIKLIPSRESDYGPIFAWAVPIGIAQMLFAFDPRSLARIKKDFLICFAIGTVASICGGLVAGALFHHKMPQYSWKISGQLTASYIGGYENAVAVGRILQIPRELFLTAFAGDSVFTSVWMLFCIVAGQNVARPKGSTSQAPDHARAFLDVTFDLTSFSFTMATLGLTLAAANVLHKLYPPVHSLIYLSAVATLATLLPWRTRLKGAYVFGAWALSAFFFACGAVSDFRLLFNSGTVIILFPLVIICVHAVLLFSIGRLLGYEWRVLLIVSQTLIGGPATALALVQARRWVEEYEAIALGLLGYAIANYVGYFIGTYFS